MEPTIYRLIDGEFFRGFCKRCADGVGAELWPALNWSLVTRKARTYIYDSLPVQKANQKYAEFEAEYVAREADLDRLRRLPEVFVKDGLGRYRKRSRKREQKGVDILLAIDAILFATRGIADELHIYTGDLDFFPLFEALQGTSCRGRLFYDPLKAPKALIPYADSAEPIQVSWLLGACAMGWGSYPRIFPSSSEPRSEGELFVSGRSIHGNGLFEMRAIEEDRAIEVKWYVNGRIDCICTDRALLAYALAEQFMVELPGDLMVKLQERTSH